MVSSMTLATGWNTGRLVGRLVRQASGQTIFDQAPAGPSACDSRTWTDTSCPLRPWSPTPLPCRSLLSGPLAHREGASRRARGCSESGRHSSRATHCRNCAGRRRSLVE
eukprot:scaffold40417_cov62-Phaeocystis_antarctica.AAC.2